MLKISLPVLIITIAIALGLTSCTSPGAILTPTQIIPHEQWITDWLDHPTCQPPCWENITVGTTTITETASILSNMPGVINPSTSKNDTGNGSTIWWEFPGNGSAGGAYTDENGAVIVKLLLSMNPSQMVRADEVLQAYGPPGYLLVRGCAGSGSQAFCTVHLIYEHGMALELFVRAEPGKVDVTPDSPVNRIWFFPPGIQGYEDEFGADQLNIHASIKNWEGYTEYSYP
jgi:hypothetical protein